MFQTSSPALRSLLATICAFGLVATTACSSDAPTCEPQDGTFDVTVTATLAPSDSAFPSCYQEGQENLLPAGEQRVTITAGEFSFAGPIRTGSLEPATCAIILHDVATVTPGVEEQSLYVAEPDGSTSGTLSFGGNRVR